MYTREKSRDDNVYTKNSSIKDSTGQVMREIARLYIRSSTLLWLSNLLTAVRFIWNTLIHWNKELVQSFRLKKSQSEVQQMVLNDYSLKILKREFFNDVRNDYDDNDGEQKIKKVKGFFYLFNIFRR